MLQIETQRAQQSKSKFWFLWRIKILINNARYLKPFFLDVDEWTIKESRTWCDITRRIGNNRAYLLRTEITKSHLNNCICQHCGVKTSTVTPSFYYVFSISLSCNINILSFIGDLWWVLLLGNHLNGWARANQRLSVFPSTLSYRS